MPRAAVKLSQAREPVPAWWDDEFHARQANIRTRLLARLPRIGRPVTAPEVRQNLLNTSYGRQEIQHMLDGLVTQGVMRRFDRSEPYNFGGRLLRTVTYYELTEQP